MNNMIDSKTVKTKTEFLVCLFLVAVTFTVYFQVGTHEFVVYDDRIYVSENQYVQEGFSKESLQWAFSLKNKDKTYWHPLTWLSHMLDVQIFGLKSGGHLMTNVILHVLNVLLLFSLLKRSTGCLWRSAFVAALFALHPMNVESVGWVAARKNVLSTTFLLLTMAAYIRYTESPGIYRYLIIAGCYAMGLMAKPMLITLPFGFLLLDFWPLKRLNLEDVARGTGVFKLLGQLIAEKIPLFILSAATISIATISLHRYGDMVQTAAVDMKLRIANALVSYVVYLEKLIWPVDLTCFYPFPETVPFWKAILSFVVLIAVSITAMRVHRKRPYVTFGWFWYLGTLVPVIGLVQAGLWPATADRFVYVPYIGIFIILSWGSAEAFKHFHLSPTALAASGGFIISILAVMSYNQTAYWKNSVTLFQHAIAVTSGNYLSHYALGFAFERRGQANAAIEHYRASLKINPQQVDVHYNLALVLASQQKIEEAIGEYQKVLLLDPNDYQVYNNLGNLFYKQGRFDDAIRQYERAIGIKPDHTNAHRNLGAALIRKGRISESVQHFEDALRLEPDNIQTKSYLKTALTMLNGPRADNK
jgi:tetratricopeptide (TPR) repeat protein